MTEEGVLRRWKEYFEDSINEEKERGGSGWMSKVSE